MREANDYLKHIIEDKDDYIHELESRPKSQNKYTPPPVIQPQPTRNFDSERVERKFKIVEEENEKLREQALYADREIERLKENIILREREIHNVKKSIVNKDSYGKDNIKQSDFGLSLETNPNLVNEMAKMSGSSGFKYTQKGPYDESLEKLRKEFSLQQKELGLETLSEGSIDKRSIFRSPDNKAMALIMGGSSLAPTGNIKQDYEGVIEENTQLKMIVGEMRKEMELVVQKLNNVQNQNSETYGYLDSNNLKLLEKQSEIDRLHDEISKLKEQAYMVGGATYSDKNISQLEKKLDEKREIIAKLKEERDNLLDVCSEMKIQINSMRKTQECAIPSSEEKQENVNFVNILKSSGSKSSNIECVKSRLDNLGQNVQDLFGEFKTALNQNKNGNIYTWKKPSFSQKKEVTVSGAQCNKILEKFEKLERDINNERQGIKSLHQRSKSRKSSKKPKKKSPLKVIPMKLSERV